VVVTLQNAAWVIFGEYLAVQSAGGASAAGTLQVTNINGNQVTLLNPSIPSLALANAVAAGLLAPVSGNILDYVGGDNASHPLIAQTNEYYDHDDFLAVFGPNSKLFLLQNSGASGAVNTNSTTIFPGHPGVLQLSPGAAASAYARAYIGCPFAIDGNLVLTIQGVMQIPAGNLVGSNQYFFGITTNPGGVIVATGSYAGILAVGGSPNWWRYTRNAAVLVDQIDTGIPAGDASWHKFKIVGALGSYSFYIDDVLIATVTDTSLPTATALLYICFFHASPTTQNATLYVDSFDIWVNPAAQSGQPASRFQRRIY
jgi:hypothetical protein